MQTKVTTSAEDAAAFMRRGGIVAFPTETVYGLGASAFDEKAVGKIFEAKMRPADNPLITHIHDLTQVDELAVAVNDEARELIRAFFPGALTLVLEKRPEVPSIATAGGNTIGIRMPAMQLTRTFLSACKTPVAAPSANLSGRPSPTTWQAVKEDLDGRIDCILMGEATEIGLESTVVDCTTGVPVLLRQGAISLDDLKEIVPATRFYAQGDEIARSPGLRHKHYAPRARVILVGWSMENVEDHAAFIGLHPPDHEFAKQLICRSVAEYAHSVFEFFRECDRDGITTIYCQTVDGIGIGAALMDRLRRAAEA